MKRFSTALIFMIGILIRIVMLGEPLLEAQQFRQTQTASLTYGMIENGSFTLTPIAPWRGDLNARVVQEFPIFNIIVLGIYKVLPFADFAGRFASLLLWVAIFWMLQLLWRFFLNSTGRFWANSLFIFSPMNWFLSTAFMPEMVLQLLSVTFVWVVLLYACRPTGLRLFLMCFFGLLGFLVKLPAFVHLAFFAFFVLFNSHHDRLWKNPLHMIGLFIVLFIVAFWGHFVTITNEKWFHSWAGTDNLKTFLGNISDRFGFRYYAKLAAYNVFFIVPLIAIPFAGTGLIQSFKRYHIKRSDRWMVYWAGSLLIFWLLWQKAAPSQSYYNLPNLVPFCILFGRGMQMFYLWLRNSRISNHQRMFVQGSVAVILVIMCLAGVRYLFRKDNPPYKAAIWLRDHTRPSDMIIYQPLHRFDTFDYQHRPLVPYYSKRRTWIWTSLTPKWERERAWQVSSYVVITNPNPHTGFPERVRRMVVGPAPEQPKPLNVEFQAFLKLIYEEENFSVYCIQRE